MPCYDSREKDDAKRNERSLRKAEAVICALMHQIKELDNFTQIIFRASTDGQVDVMSYAKSHMKEDQARLLDVISGLSQDELKTLKEMI